MAKNIPAGGYYMFDLSDVVLQDDESGTGVAEFRGQPGLHPDLYAAMVKGDKPIMLISAPAGCVDTDPKFAPATLRATFFVGGERNYNNGDSTYENVFMTVGSQALYVTNTGEIGITVVP